MRVATSHRAFPQGANLSSAVHILKGLFQQAAQPYKQDDL